MDTLSSPQFTFASPRSQHFSIPKSIVYYFTKHPTNSRGWKNLVKTSKYFYSKNPIVVVNNFLLSHNDIAEITIYLPNLLTDERKTINMKTIQCKFWITLSITFWDGIISDELYIQKIYPLNIITIIINLKTTMIHEDLAFLASSKQIQTIMLYCETIKKKDGRLVEFDKILKLFPKIKRFEYSSKNNILSTEIINRMNELPCFEKLEFFQYGNISYELNLDAFSIFMKKHKNTTFDLNFSDISEEYAAQLQILAENVIREGENYSMRVMLQFPGMSNETYKDLRRLALSTLQRPLA